MCFFFFFFMFLAKSRTIQKITLSLFPQCWSKSCQWTHRTALRKDCLFMSTCLSRQTVLKQAVVEIQHFVMSQTSRMWNTLQAGDSFILCNRHMASLLCDLRRTLKRYLPSGNSPLWCHKGETNSLTHFQNERQNIRLQMLTSYLDFVPFQTGSRPEMHHFLVCLFFLQDFAGC